MTEEQLTRIFGDITLVQALLWFFASCAFLGVLWWAWPKLAAAVRTLDMIAGLTGRLASVDDKLERVRAQVENSHSTNLRDDLDRDRKAAEKRHEEVLEEMRGMKKDIGRIDTREIDLGRELRDTRNEVGSVRRELTEHIEWSRAQEDRIDNLETTLNPKETP